MSLQDRAGIQEGNYVRRTRSVLQKVYYCLICIVTVVFALQSRPVSARRSARYKKAGFVEFKGIIYMSVGFPGLFNRKLKKQIKSGFVQTIVVELTVRDAVTNKRMAETLWTCTVVYDLWEDRYLIRIADAARRETHRVKTLKEAIVRSTSIERLPLIKAKKIEKSRQYYVGMRLLYNPMSRDLMRKVKKWLKTPRTGGHDRLLGGSSFFGSSLSFFINPRISPAERTLRVRTQNFYMTEE